GGEGLAGVATGFGGEDAADLPVFGGNEGFNFTFALDDQPHGHALHAAGAQALGDFAPEDGADFPAHDAVEDAARLLGVDPVHVDGHGVLKRLLDLGLRDRVEDDALRLLVRDAKRFLKVPGDGLALAVQVGRQIDLATGLGQGLEFVDDLA